MPVTTPQRNTTQHHKKGAKKRELLLAPLDELVLNEANPCHIRPERLEDLKRALVEDPDMLWARPVIALPDGTVIAGNEIHPRSTL